MAVNNPAINGRFYSWASIRFNFLGMSVNTVVKISYGDEDEIKGVKGVGNKKIGYTQDNTEANGSIGLLAETFEALVRRLPPGKRIQEIAPFPITVSFVDDAGGLNSHVLIGCKIIKNSREASAGSSDAISVESPLYIHDIDWQA